MMKEKIKNSSGISLISLAISVIILALIANLIIYNVKENLSIGKLKGMQNDIVNLRDKVASYYEQNGKLPASKQYTNIDHIKSAGVIKDDIDTGNFLVIELSALENLTLNYGEDYEKIKIETEGIDEYDDLYIINETSHNIFYVRGITIDKEIFYTDYTAETADSKAVDLRYVDGIKIPDGYVYQSGTIETGMVIKSEDGTKQYMWIENQEIISEIPNGVQIATSEKEDFIKSANAYRGYYKNVNGNDVIYFLVDKWSLAYDKEGKYTDENGDTISIPEGFQVSEVPGQNNIKDGLVVRDSNKNEWVWIEVPKTVTADATTDDDIKNALIDYTTNYRGDYSDTWYNGCGLEENEYAQKYSIMLQSIKENGGFYIGRYEVGSFNNPVTSNDSKGRTAVIQEGAYPYNYVTCSQAQELSENLATGNKTGSLMFGIQWDLVLKFLETNGVLQEDLNTNSGSWGNYKNETFDIIKGKYLTDTGTNYIEVGNEGYSKLASSILLTTGATERNSKKNIYDLAGNVWEWTLEKSIEIDNPCVSRGGICNGDSLDFPVAYHNINNISNSDSINGFRTVLY